MMKRAVEFYSEGFKLQGDVYTPDGLSPGERRAAVLLCHGYTGVKDLYLPDNARVLNEAGYVAMTFDYKGWGQSEGVSPAAAGSPQPGLRRAGGHDLPRRAAGGGRGTHRHLRHQLWRGHRCLDRRHRPAGQVRGQRGRHRQWYNAG